MTIAIIGGGIAGASTAYHLARAGRDVSLFERGEIASEASGVNAGSIGALGWGRGVADLQATLTTGSLEIFRALQLDLGYDVEFRQSGVNAGSIGALGWGRGVADLQATLTTGSLEIFRALQLDLGYDVEFRQSG